LISNVLVRTRETGDESRPVKVLEERIGSSLISDKIGSSKSIEEKQKEFI
jgi:hypothetical protein